MLFGYLLTAGLTVALGAAALAQGSVGESTNSYHFREPRPIEYVVQPDAGFRLLATGTNSWVRATRRGGLTNQLEFGSRIVLQLAAESRVEAMIAGRPLRVARVVTSNVFILQAPDAWTALAEAQRLADRSGVLTSHPIARRPWRRHAPYAAKPNDPYFPSQWHLENRDAGSGQRLGVDLNVRAAWPFTRGEGVIIAICDDGVDLGHPDLTNQADPALHYNFWSGLADGNHPTSLQMHGTAVAGLAIAQGDNHIGVSGVAPGARFESSVIFLPDDSIVSDESLMDMFEYSSNVVSVQNHSWGNATVGQLGPSLIEQIAISNAVAFGRGGLGVIMVRAGGNGRGQSQDANDDGYASDPRVVAVAAVRFDGRAASYSSAGACLLVAAPSGDSDDGFPTIFTTDRQGDQGYNQGVYTNDLADYAFGDTGFSGTSASTPQISGLVALLLSANPGLTWRDVQQILILSARQTDPADPDLTTNAAGFAVSHNLGFGLPDAGRAVALARRWINRPAATNLTFTSTNVTAIPDDGLRLLIGGAGVPDGLASIPSTPSLGPNADTPTAVLPLVDVGDASAAITLDLTNKAALIQRGGNLFSEKIGFAAAAGAALAIIYDNRGESRITMGGTDFVPIPAVFISQIDGLQLQSLLQQTSNVTAQVKPNSVSYSFVVTNTLSLEHVGVEVIAAHPSRGDLRITLLSPGGTRSVLQRVNSDATSAGDWTYYSTHHFFEPSAGTWQVFFTDEQAGLTGAVQFVGLTLTGTPITDTDHDGLDDNWEMAHFGTLAYGAQDDPDHDGYSNIREYLMGTDPLTSDAPLAASLSLWDENLARLSWPSVTNQTYGVFIGPDAASPLTLITNLAGGFPETEWFIPYSTLNHQFFRLRAQPVGP